MGELVKWVIFSLMYKHIGITSLYLFIFSYNSLSSLDSVNVSVDIFH